VTNGTSRDPGSLPEAVAALFPQSAERLRIEDWLTRQLLAATARIQSGPVTPTQDIAKVRAELAAFDFNTPLQADAALAWAIERLQQGIVQMHNPRYFGLFNPGPSFPAQCADRIASTFNPQLASSASSPFPVALENHVIRAIGIRAGLP